MPTSNERKMLCSNEALKELKMKRDINQQYFKIVTQFQVYENSY